MCSQCGGTVKVIPCIEDPVVIKKILTSPDGQSPVSQIRSVAREPDATTGSFVRLTLGEPMTQLNRQDVGWPEGRDWPESGDGEAGFSMMMAEFSKNL